MVQFLLLLIIELEKEIKESAAFCQSNNEDYHNDKEEDFVPEFALHVGELHERKWLLDSGCSKQARAGEKISTGHKSGVGAQLGNELG